MEARITDNQRAASDLDLPALKNLVESLLFVAGGPVQLGQLEKALGVTKSALAEALAALQQDCHGRGVRIQQQDGTVQMVTSPEAAPFIEPFLGIDGRNRLSPAAMETMAIIAYRQPMTRARIEAIRGVNSDHVVATLLARGLIAEVGRLETAGRPTLLATTPEFLQYFGIESPQDLPPLPEDTDERLG